MSLLLPPGGPHRRRRDLLAWVGLDAKAPAGSRGQGHRTGGSSAPAPQGPRPHECGYGGQTRARGLQAGSAHPFTCAGSFPHREVFILLYRRGHGGPGKWADCPRAPGARLTPPRPPCAHAGVGGSPSPPRDQPGPEHWTPKASSAQTRPERLLGGRGRAGRRPSWVLSVSTPSPSQSGSPRRVSACEPRLRRPTSHGLRAVNTRSQPRKGTAAARGALPGPGTLAAVLAGRDHPRGDPDLAWPGGSWVVGQQPGSVLLGHREPRLPFRAPNPPRARGNVLFPLWSGVGDPR